MIQQIRFFEDNLPLNGIEASYDGKYVLITNTKTQRVYIISQKPEDHFRVNGFYDF